MTDLRGEATAGAMALLAERYGEHSAGEYVATVAAALRTVPAGELAPGAPSIDELRAAITLLPTYLDEVEEDQRRIIAAARAGRPALTWQEIGLLLGFPANTAKQRASKLATRLGIRDSAPTT